MLLGLRTVIYPVADLDEAKRALMEALSIAPYFDEPFYVGFNVSGYELALDPDGDPAAGPTVYWGVPDLDAAIDEYASRGALISAPAEDVGDGIRTAVLELPSSPSTAPESCSGRRASRSWCSWRRRSALRAVRSRTEPPT